MAVTGNKGATLPIGAYNQGAPVAGARATTDVGSGRKVPQVAPKILEINKNVVPFTAFMDKMSKRARTIAQIVFTHIESDLIPATITIDDGTAGAGAQVAGTAGAYTNSDTTIGTAVAQGGSGPGNLVVGSVLKTFRTGEVLRVTAIDTATGIITVATRGYITNGAAAAALNANEELQVLGTAFGQNSTAPGGVSVEPKLINAYPQTFRTAIEAGRRAIKMENYGGDEWERIMNDRLMAHHVDVEKAFLFNQGYSATEPTQTDGLINQITTNVFIMGGALDEVTLENYWCALMRRNQGQNGSIVTFGGENAIKALDQFGRDSIRYTDKTVSLGIDVQEWKSTFGVMKIKQHGLFSPLGSSETAANGAPVGFLLSVNMDNVGKATFAGGKLTYDAKAKLPGTDGEKGCWTEDCGLEVWNERSHAIITGIIAP